MTNIRVGLVLSGGGAKGAYQVGVLKALVELGAQVDAIAGASIGSLNGAILASAPSLAEGTNRLEEVWQTLAESSPLSLKMPNYLKLLALSGLRLNGLNGIEKIINMAKAACGKNIPPWCDEWFQVVDGLDSGLLTDAPLQKLMDKFLDGDALAQGLPLYVSVFRSTGAIADILSCLAGELGFSDSPESEFIHIQSLSKDDQRNVLLASAAIPLLFAPRMINDTLYSDGGQGGWSKMQGNTPVSPLLKAGYRQIIVTHLSDGSLWSRHDFPDATVLEIRPRLSINRDGGAKDLLGFDARKIPSWIQQGYEDTLHSLDRVIKASGARSELLLSTQALNDSENIFAESDKNLAAAMARL